MGTAAPSPDNVDPPMIIDENLWKLPWSSGWTKVMFIVEFLKYNS